MSSGPIDRLPIWVYFPLSIALGMAMLEIGYRFGRWRRVRFEGEKEAPVAAMVASLLGLLAFILAFTFSMAASRFDARRQAVLREANAIGTTYLRSKLLPAPENVNVGELLLEYAKLRSIPATFETVPQLMASSDELHRQLWSAAVAAASKDPRSITTGLFLESLNELIDLHAERVFFGLRNRVPESIWIALVALTALGQLSIGYQAGLAGTRRSPEMPILSISFAVVLLLIVDLDHGQEGWMRVSHQAIEDVRDSIASELSRIRTPKPG